MSQKTFHMRLACRYQAPDNSVVDLQAEHQVEAAWQEFELNLGSPGFQMFLSAVLSCQHMYFRLNCAERGLVLSSAEGSLEAVTNQDWELLSLDVRFAGHLASGVPSQEAIDYIVARMGCCPVSVNLKPVADSRTQVEFD